MMLQNQIISQGSPTDNVFTKLYSPINWTYQRIPFVRKPLGIYGHLWAPKRFLSNGNPTIPPGK
jgi:hypothetical protein